MVVSIHDGKLKAKITIREPGSSCTKKQYMSEATSEAHLAMPDRGTTWVLATSEESEGGTVFLCSYVEDWLQEESKRYRCLHVPRPLAWDAEQQEVVDLLALSRAFGREDQIREDVRVFASEQRFLQELSAKARRLVQRAMGVGLPGALGQRIQLDAEEVGAVMKKLFPISKEVLLKLELVSESSCSRWHQDNYTCRAIITYVGNGTEYTDHSNVNFWELNNCGNNDHILSDKSQVYSSDAGDVLLIKGKKFPNTVRGVVHKSPEKRYHENGAIMTRLCLKLDVQ
jgi:hypothetical protein